MSYLDETRGLDPDLAGRYGVTEKPLNRGGEAVVIAYRRGGETYGHKIRPLDPGDGPRFFFHPKGAIRDLWNVDCLRDDTLAEVPVIITEGELDAMSCIEAGFPRAVSIPDGWTANYDGGDGPKSKPILDNLPLLKRSPFVIAAGDADQTGQSFARAVSNLLDGHPCKFVRYPDGCKDANEVLAKHGAGELARCINRAEWFDPEGGRITGFTDLPPQPMGAVFRPYEPLDRVMCFHTGFPTIVTGIPSSGKSTLLRFALWQAQRRHGIRIGLGMFENPAIDTLDHLCRLEMGRPLDDVSAAEEDALRERLDGRWRLLHMADAETRDHDMGWVRDMMQAAAVRDGCRIVVLDPWNEIEHVPARGETVTQYTNVALAKIRQWSERFDCSVVIVAHPTKMRTEPGQQPKPPLGYDISDSAAWFNKAACGVTVHRVDDPEHGSRTQVFTWKSKFEQRYGFGKGKVALEFDPLKMCYREGVGT